jgi:catalase
MDGFGSHTYSMINAGNERIWVKFHFKTAQGIKNFTNDEAVEMKGKDPDFAQRDLHTAIENKEFPKWNLKIQVMTLEEAKTFRYNPFDLTKVWPHKDFPLIDVGVLELNENPKNYFADVEQAAFAPAHAVPGIDYSPDKMLQGRILSYPDAHRHRLGVNYEQIPVNRCPYAVNNYERDGAMRVDGNGESNPNYFPNSFDNIKPDESYKNVPPPEVGDSVFGWYNRNAEGENDHYSQPGNFYRQVLSDYDKKELINNIAGAMSGISGPKKDEIVNRQLCHFFRADIGLGMAIATALGVNPETAMPKQHAVEV